MEWSIQQIAKLSGTTSRALRHYGDVGLLVPARVGPNGYRYYDEDNLVTLQRILLLREMGLSLDDIRGVLRREVGEGEALAAHLRWLHGERERLERQINAVTLTLQSRKKGVPLVAEETFDGFSQYKEEVAQRWGADAAHASNQWWSSKSAAEKSDFMTIVKQLNAAWIEAFEAGVDAESARAQELAARHVAWVTSVPGTPVFDGGDVAWYVLGLGELYVADERFAANYGGVAGASFVRDALAAYVGEGSSA